MDYVVEAGEVAVVSVGEEEEEVVVVPAEEEVEELVLPLVPNCSEMDQVDTHNHSNHQDGHLLKHNRVQVYSSGLYFEKPDTGYCVSYYTRWGLRDNSDKIQYHDFEGHLVGHDHGSG